MTLGYSESAKTDYNCEIPENAIAFDEKNMMEKLLNLDKPCFAVKTDKGIGLCNDGSFGSGDSETLAYIPPFSDKNFGDTQFQNDYGTKYCLYGGAMANGIASEEMVIELGKNGFFGSFGSAGLIPSRVEEAIIKIQKALPEGPYAFNLIHSPSEPAMEQGAVDLYLKYKVRCIEAAAYMALTLPIVQYRVSGLSLDNDNKVVIKNRIIAKISRKEVATRFMQPAPQKILKKLLEKGLITDEQAELSQRVPMADDITVEADSGGHTDNRPLVSLLPSILSLKAVIQDKFNYDIPVRIGAGGGVGTPEAALATFMMGASYVVTGSVNQGCIESGTSEHVKKLLSTIDMADVIMAPAADMFEMGVEVQVLKRGSLFPMRAAKLYDIYNSCESIETIPTVEREKIEKTVFKKSLDEIWSDTVAFFEERDPAQIKKAEENPKRKMALIFRWYLGLSSRWANIGEKGREMDYQIWCGAAMGAFNSWVNGTYLESHENRKVVNVNRNILKGAALFYRLQSLKNQGIEFPFSMNRYIPQKSF
ncbi:MAG: PfaD family polyunsaturated fatty acid/polyketide biosynthesis protein [Desulfobacterales bacterium]|nr:PfaD family polyunsaturated fatty acid/polyketide biosynthesis protein [Desulfobacterales bacterium]MCP4163887.1 PfaD family polyunsaturated fatty acid/polyketide biosynthesis protein [Deltaproteobacteria bacterium]